MRKMHCWNLAQCYGQQDRWHDMHEAARHIISVINIHCLASTRHHGDEWRRTRWSCYKFHVCLSLHFGRRGVEVCMTYVDWSAHHVHCTSNLNYRLRYLSNIILYSSLFTNHGRKKRKEKHNVDTLSVTLCIYV